MHKAPSAVVTRRQERSNQKLPHLKVDFSHPETFFDVLKQMNIQEGSEIEIEQVRNGILIKPILSQEEALKAALIHPFISIQEQKLRFTKAAQEMKKLSISEDSQDLDSEWWIEKVRNTAKPSNISMDDE